MSSIITRLPVSQSESPQIVAEGPDPSQEQQASVGDAYTDVLVMFNVGHQLLNTTGIG